MPLVGQWLRWRSASSWGSSPYTETWSIEMAPSAALAEVSFNFYMEYSGGVSMVNPRIDSIRRRKPDNSDETVVW